MPHRKALKYFLIIGSVAGGLVALGVIGSFVNKTWDSAVLSEAEAGLEFVSQDDFKVTRALDDIQVSKENIGKMEGVQANHRIAILRGQDVDRVYESEIIRISLRIKEEEDYINRKRDYIECIEEEHEHCRRLLGEPE